MKAKSDSKRFNEIREEIKNAYFQYLVGLIGGHGYELLCQHLHDIVAYSLVYGDVNRELEGRDLRSYFMLETGVGEWLMEAPCTVFELLIGLAGRLHGLVTGYISWSISECFWVLLENLGLENLDNLVYSSSCGGTIVDRKIKIFLSRNYGQNGENGSLFPLQKRDNFEKKCQNMQNEDLWKQMNLWFLENFDVVGLKKV